jgi:hypothetical protein
MDFLFHRDRSLILQTKSDKPHPYTLQRFAPFPTNILGFTLSNFHGMRPVTKYSQITLSPPPRPRNHPFVINLVGNLTYYHPF